MTDGRIGIHISIAGSLAAAAEKAHEMGINTMQIFSSSPRMWHAAPLDPKDIAEMVRLRRQYDIAPLVIHDSYLINLPAADKTVRARSIAAFRGEVERANEMGAEYLVAHPGSWREQTVETAIAQFAESLEKATERCRPGGVTLLLECTAGQGCALGMRLEELAELAAASRGRTPLQMGYCLDTCHLFAAGYDVASEEGLERTLELAAGVLELENIPVIHTNDSKTPCGSRRDRHANIGKGEIGEAAFRRILSHPKLAGKAFILETPCEEEGDDLRDIELLRRFAKL